MDYDFVIKAFKAQGLSRALLLPAPACISEKNGGKRS